MTIYRKSKGNYEQHEEVEIFTKKYTSNVGGKASMTASGQTYFGKPEIYSGSQKLDFELDLKLDKEEETVVPFGILDFKNNPENPFFNFKYTLKNSDIDSLDFKITDENNEVIYQMGYLKPVIILAQKKPLILFEAKKTTQGPLISKTWGYQKLFAPYVLSEPDYTKRGEYHLNWDGFDNDEIYDSTKFAGKKLKAQIIATKEGKVKTKEIEFEVSYKEVDWVDVIINRNTKRIDVTLRVNLTDGGENGLTCQTINANMYGTPARTVCDWDKIPPSVLNPNNPVIKSRTRSFSDLEKLALDGLNYHWGRNRNHAVAKNININGDLFELYINTFNVKENTMNTVKLTYNTNNDWMRSGNPSKVRDVVSTFGKLVSGERIAYNIGYLNNVDWYEISKQNWYYSDAKKYKVDENFSDTSAHEIGHTILQAYGGTEYSYTHAGTSDITQRVIKISDGGKSYFNELRTKGEINLMYYYEDEPWSGNRDYAKYAASEEDVLSLLWLTKIKVS
uniref:hypothetical protein n=1 Tax=Flavobacterium sp. Root935 TaxID=1736610 RepID=UPI000A891B06|nr:hypothetical protein [Flavobacterium sp. Root935]